MVEFFGWSLLFPFYILLKTRTQPNTQPKWVIQRAGCSQKLLESLAVWQLGRQTLTSRVNEWGALFPSKRRKPDLSSDSCLNWDSRNRSRSLYCAAHLGKISGKDFASRLTFYNESWLNQSCIDFRVFGKEKCTKDILSAAGINGQILLTTFLPGACHVITLFKLFRPIFPAQQRHIQWQ